MPPAKLPSRTNATPTDPFQMLYCDKGACRVNTFEHGADGDCPACGETGESIR